MRESGEEKQREKIQIGLERQREDNNKYKSTLDRLGKEKGCKNITNRELKCKSMSERETEREREREKEKDRE